MQGKSNPRPNSQRSQEMRARLIDVARKLFVEKGFTITGTPEIVQTAKVTRGALYHHFNDKTDLFRAVIKTESIALANDIRKNAQGGDDAFEALREGTLAYFKAMQTPGRVRLLLLDGPSVLGQIEMATIDAQNGGATLRHGLQELLPLRGARLDALADILSAGFDRAAIAVAQGAAHDIYQDALLNLLETLIDLKKQPG